MIEATKSISRKLPVYPIFIFCSILLFFAII